MNKLNHPIKFYLMLFCFAIWGIGASYMIGFPGKNVIPVVIISGSFGILGFILCVVGFPFYRKV